MLPLLHIFVLQALLATTPHYVTLTWSDPVNPPGTTYNLYRANGLCSGSPAYNKIQTGIAALTVDDHTVVIGNLCYYVTAVSNNIESAPSNTAAALVPAEPPATLTATVH
jgi:hypothetical protein